MRAQQIAFRALGKGVHKAAGVINLFGGSSMVVLRCTQGRDLEGIYSCWSGPDLSRQQPCPRALRQRLGNCGGAVRIGSGLGATGQ